MRALLLNSAQILQIRAQTGDRQEKLCPLRGSSAMQPGEAAHRARGESEQAPGAGVRAAPGGWRGTGGPRVALGPSKGAG
jgi:hypothetical protein